MIGFPNAKINLGLDIINKRNDGYHNISSVFYPILELYDVLEIIPNRAQDDEFYFSGLSIPGTQDSNLIYKAISLLREHFEIPCLNIYLHKVIPMGAGLGGGSADGSFALRMINELFDLGLSNLELESYALKLGSDCPFFIENHTALAQGRGEELQLIELDLSKYYIVIAISDIHISTGEAYKNVQLNSNSEIQKIVRDKPVDQWSGLLINGFEPFAIENYPKLAKVKEYLLEKGASYVSMTGSGSAIYGLFRKEPNKLNLQEFRFWKGKA